MPLLAGVSQVLGNVFGNIGRRKAQKRANRDNIAFWNMQNEYNHPSAQKARLEEAGLNPNLIYGTSPTSAVGNTGPIAPSKAASQNYDNPLIGMQLFADVKQKEAQTDNLHTQNTVLQNEALLKAMQTANLTEQTAKNKVEAEVARELKQTSVDFQKENLRKLELQTIGQELDNTFKDQSMQDRVKSLMYQASNAKATLQGTNLLNALRSLEVDLKKIGIERNDPWYFRILGRNWKQIHKQTGEILLDAVKQ